MPNNAAPHVHEHRRSSSAPSPSPSSTPHDLSPTSKRGARPTEILSTYPIDHFPKTPTSARLITRGSILPQWAITKPIPDAGDFTASARKDLLCKVWRDFSRLKSRYPTAPFLCRGDISGWLDLVAAELFNLEGCLLGNPSAIDVERRQAQEYLTRELVPIHLEGIWEYAIKYLQTNLDLLIDGHIHYPSVSEAVEILLGELLSLFETHARQAVKERTTDFVIFEDGGGGNVNGIKQTLEDFSGITEAVGSGVTAGRESGPLGALMEHNNHNVRLDSVGSRDPRVLGSKRLKENYKPDPPGVAEESSDPIVWGHS